MKDLTMKVLIVAHVTGGKFSPFVTEQAAALAKAGCVIEKFGVEGKGFIGYLKNLPKLKRSIREFAPDALHAHYGLSGLLANMQRRCPVVTTYHGSDIHSGGWVLKLSRICMRLSKFNIFVSRFLLERSGYKKDNVAVIPCGVDMDLFSPMEKYEAREALGMLAFDDKKKYILFAGSFDNPVKNALLAKETVNLINQKFASEMSRSAVLLNLKGYSREQVNLLLNAADCLLMTSEREGSPMIIKEAMAAGRPIVSVDVGDVADVVSGVPGCFIAERNISDIADKLSSALEYSDKCEAIVSSPDSLEGRKRLIEKGLVSDQTARRLVRIYELLLNGVG